MWWANDFLQVERNALLIAGRRATAIAERHGTPLYVYGRSRILANYKTIRGLLAEAGPGLESRVSYAAKANSHPRILRLLEGKGAWLDAVSPAEVRAALEAGFPAGRILYTGTSVSEEDLKAVFGHEGLTVNIDALEQIELMKEVRDRWFPKRRIRVSVRWNPGVGRGFTPRAVTAGARAADGTPVKFGVEDAKVVRAFRQAVRSGFVPVGLHQHLGSGWVKEDFPAVKEAVRRMVAKAAALERGGLRLEFLDFGGGFGPRFHRTQGLFPTDAYVRHILRSVALARLSIRAVAVEPGKALVADAGVLLLRVVYVKRSYGNIIACVNAGTFNSVPRPAVYDQAHHEIINASRVASAASVRVTIAGHLCETGDVFGKDRPLPMPRRGDILAVLHAGGYSRSMASHYNSRPIPKEIVV
ncbi:MAG: diaminopimelate decarboxylase [Candidatus Aminicenantes bacterium]|nr:diaminopimelate decarboxylase [Candidatus Aminicenantes bacterium]